MIAPYYSDNTVTIYHGNRKELLPTLGRVNLCFADPPYGIGKAEWDTQYPIGFENACLEVADILAVTPGEWALPLCMMTLGGRYRGMLVGHNLNGMTFSNIGFSNFIPVLLAGGKIPNGQTCFDFVIDSDKPDHPSPKPVQFMKWVVNRLTTQGETILDPFMGSGTTLLAAKDLGRKAIDIEIEERYCEIAVRRLAQEVLPL